MDTIKEKLNDPEPNPSPICKQIYKRPSLAQMNSACRAPSGPVGLADLYFSFQNSVLSQARYTFRMHEPAMVCVP